MNEMNSKHEGRLLGLGGGCVLIVLIALLLPRRQSGSPGDARSTNAAALSVAGIGHDARPAGVSRQYRDSGSSVSAEEIVARKLKQFGSSRHELARAMARHFKVDVPDDVEHFFNAVEAGQWEAVDAAHKALLLNEKELNQPRSAELHQIWRAIQETWGVAREAHDWPAQKLLDYGQAVLGSLKPGMIYVGGTDPG